MGKFDPPWYSQTVVTDRPQLVLQPVSPALDYA